jgi:hypothetical protein
VSEEFRSKFDPTRRRGDGDVAAALSASPVADDEEDADPGDKAFSLLSADRRHKLMLEFRFKTGNAVALAYSYLVSVHLDPSKAIRMDFSGYEVILSGRNLAPLFSALVSQRVAVVREMDDLQAEANLPQGETVVTEITVGDQPTA